MLLFILILLLILILTDQVFASWMWWILVIIIMIALIHFILSAAIGLAVILLIDYIPKLLGSNRTLFQLIFNI